MQLGFSSQGVLSGVERVPAFGGCVASRSWLQRDAVGWPGTSRAGFLLPMETTSQSAHPSPASPNPPLAVTPSSLPALLSARISLEQIFTGGCSWRLDQRGGEPGDTRWPRGASSIGLLWLVVVGLFGFKTHQKTKSSF